jgi:tetratricopeptide (TPR) repeat protein
MTKTFRNVIVLLAIGSCACPAFAGPGNVEQSGETSPAISLQSESGGAPSSLFSLGAGSAQGSNSDTFSVSSLTLTGIYRRGSAVAPAQTLEELKGKIQSAFELKDYGKVLEYTSVDLVGSPEVQILLLKARALALAKLGRLPDAIATLKYISIMDPGDLDVLDNIAELLLLTGQLQEYREFSANHKQRLDSAYGGFLQKYFEALEAYQTDDAPKFRETIIGLLQSLPAGKHPVMKDWSFSQLLSATNSQPPSRKKVVLMTFISVLMGDLDRNEALARINDL